MLVLLPRSLCLVMLGLLSLNALGSPVSSKGFSETKTSSVYAATSRPANIASASGIGVSSSVAASSSALPSGFPKFKYADPVKWCAAYRALFHGTDPATVTKLGDVKTNPKAVKLKPNDNSSTATTTRSDRRGPRLPSTPLPLNRRYQVEYATGKYGRTTFHTEPMEDVAPGAFNQRIVKVIAASWAAQRKCETDNPSSTAPHILKEVKTREELDKEGDVLDDLGTLYDSGRLESGNYYLVMLKVPGVTIGKTHTWQTTATSMEAAEALVVQAKELTLQAMYRTWRKTGWVHLDPHNGNTFFLESVDANGRYHLAVANLVDWGISEKRRRTITSQEFYEKYRRLVDRKWRNILKKT